MNFTPRLRRSGILMIASLATLATSACKDGFFFEPASTGPTPITVQYSYVSAAEGPELAGAPEAFDKADGAQVTITHQSEVLFNERVALEASGTDKKLSVSLELPTGSVMTTQLQVTLLQGASELFAGSATASITPGQAAEVTVNMTGVVDDVALNADAVTLRILGETFQLSTTGLFASGDTVGPVSATYQALGSAVSVASDGTVTAVSNGTADVQASYLGKTAVASVTVDDRCIPGPLPPFGTTFTGVLDDLDCQINDTDNRVGDFFSFTLTDQTALRFSLASSDYVPRWWLFEETGPGRGLDFDGFARVHQLDGDPGFEAVVLPPGDYRIVLFAHFDDSSARGSYSFTSQVITEDNDFVCPADEGEGTLWITPGYEGDQDFGGGCVGNIPGLAENQDRFGVYLEPGVEYLFRAAAPGGEYVPNLFIHYIEEVASTHGATTPYQELRYTAPAGQAGWHGFTVLAAPGTATGPYHVWFDEASKAAEPCVGAPTSVPGTMSGTLTYTTDCYFQGYNASSYYNFSLSEETTILGTMSASLNTNWGILEPTGDIDNRHRYVTGNEETDAIATLPAGDYSMFVSAAPGQLGPWSLTTVAASKDASVSCDVRVHILPGFFGSQTLDDACQLAGTGQNQDRYRVYLKGGQQYSVNVVSDNVTTGLGVFGPDGDVSPAPDLGAGATAPVQVVGPSLSNALTFVAPETTWYVIVVTGASPGSTGTYSLSFEEGGLTGDGMLSGSVTADGTPLPGVSVTLTGATSVSAVTDASGNYSISGIPLGVYTASLSGLPSDVAMDPVSESFTFNAPGQSKVFNFTGTFAASGTVAGSVTVEGAPLAGVTVTLSGPSSASVTTDAAGSFSFTGLGAGTYVVAISGIPSDASFSSLSQSVTLATSGSAVTVNFAGVVIRTSAVQGHVLGDGVGLEGVTVTLVGPDGTVTTTTDALGDYAFTGLRAGNYIVTISGFMVSAYTFSVTSQGVTVAVGETKVVNFQGVLDPEPLFSVSVVVSSDPNGHEEFIEETTTTAVHVEIHAGNKISIFNTLPDTRWVTVSGTVKPDGTFVADGKGTVAGFPDVDVKFEGTVSHDGNMTTSITGTLTMGPGTQLPADGGGNHNPAIYTVNGSRVP